MKRVVCESCEAEFSIKHSMDDYYYRVTYCTFCGTELINDFEDEFQEELLQDTEWEDEDE